MKFNLFKRKNKHEFTDKETTNSDTVSLTEDINESMENKNSDFIKSVEYHTDPWFSEFVKESAESSALANNPGSEQIIIDNITPNKSIERSKEIIDILNAKDKIIGFKAEIREFQDELRKKTEAINSLCENLMEKTNRYINNASLI